MNWYEYPIVVPFGNLHYDVNLGGAHDLDVGCPPNTPITALLPGQVSSITAPSWGMQLGIRLITPYNGIPYMAYLHLAAVKVPISLGDYIGKGAIIGWSGGCNAASQYAGTSNPTGKNFLNTLEQSSQPQCGIALMRGPEYGVGEGWTIQPDPALNPTQLILDARNEGKVNVVQFTTREKQLWGRLENVPLNEGAAIAQSWLAALRRTHYFGPALENEVSDGNFQCQAFACAYAKWDRTTGVTHWFTQQGEYHF